MKKKLFSLIIFAFLITGILSACNTPTNISGEFALEHYVVSIDDTTNFLDELTLKGIEKTEIVLSSSNQEILADEGQGNFKAIKSGEAYIFAKNENNVIAQAKVTVKYKFSSPKNIKIDENGVVSWNRSFVVINDQTIYADEYKIAYAKYNADGSLGNTSEEIVTTNNFELGEKGAFNFQIQANKDSSNEIDASEIEETSLNNGVVGLIGGVQFEVAEEIGVQTARLSWTAKEGIVYDIFVEGFKIYENSHDNFFDFDYSRFEGGEIVEVQIVAKDSTEMKLPTTSSFILNKLPTPEVEYVYESNNGCIGWNGDINASSYIMKVYDFDGGFEIYNIDNADEIREFLTEYEGDIYNIAVMAVGQDENGFYLNSDTSESKTFSKIQTPEIKVEFEGKNAQITFDSDAYSENYRITYGETSFVYNTYFGLNVTVSLSDFEVGSHLIEIVALPNVDETSATGVEAIEYREIQNALVINSKTISFEFFILDEFGEITHSLSGDNSTISAYEIENANIYLLYINGVIYEDAEFLHQDGKVYFAIENLNQIAPIDNEYTFKILAKRIIEGQETSIEVEKTKTISILPIVSQGASQTNGFFAWNKIEGAEYNYEVYLTDEEFNVLLPNDPVISATTTEMITSPELAQGYYFIKIYTKSTDFNFYLDSNFVDENKYYTQNFIVEKQIDAPEIYFSDENDIYALTIHHVEFGGRYQVFVDGQLDGEFTVDQIKDKYEYLLENDFEESKGYEVSVVASSGILFDGTIYTESKSSLINVERLAPTTFKIEYPEDIYQRKTNENLIFTQIENSIATEVKLEGNIVLSDGYKIDLMDYSKFGGQFTLVAKYIAQDYDGEVYYLDSIAKEIKFKRATSPNMINFNNGKINWKGTPAEEFDCYKGTVALINKDIANYYSFTIDKALTEFNLQEFIDKMSTNPTFYSLYRQSEKIQVELYAFGDGEQEDCYILPSQSGTTTKGEKILDIFTIEKPQLLFNPSTRILSWTKQAEGSKYDIYVDEVLAVEGHESNLITLAKIGDFDYLIAKSIQIKTSNNAYLTSQFSDEIKIEELQISKDIAISKSTESYIATLNILEDQSYVSSVYVNDSVENVNYVQGSTVATFDFANYQGETKFEIYLKAKNESSTNYYLDSKVVVFEIKNIANEKLEIEHFETNVINAVTPVNDDHLRWNDLRENIIGCSVQPIVYRVKVTNDGNEYTFTTGACQFNLEEIESLINMGLRGEVKVSVTAIVDRDYILSSGEDSLGYYGQIDSLEYTTAKLEMLDIYEMKVIEEERASSPLKQKLFSGLEVVFEDKWTDYDNLIFTFEWDTSVKIFTDANLSTGELKLDSGYYHAYFKVSDFNSETLEDGFFNNLDSVFNITVRRVNTINSDSTEFVIERLSEITTASVTDEGILTISYSRQASFLLEIKISDKIITKDIASAKEIDLLSDDLFGEESGEYQISILPFDENKQLLPAKTTKIIKGNKLAGIENIAVDELGNIKFSLLQDDFYNLKFTSKLVNGVDIKKDFDARKVEGSLNDYEISMREIFELFAKDCELTSGEYSFEFTIRDGGSINASWKPLTLVYQTGDNPILVRSTALEQDYLLFDYDENTTAFNIGIYAMFGDSFKTKEVCYYPNNVKGYWVTDTDGENGYYAKNKGTADGMTYTQYYIINLRSLLSSIEYGDIKLNIARVGKYSSATFTGYCQFNSYKCDLYKLNKINDNIDADEFQLSIRENVLSWTWTQQDASSKIAPNAYYLVRVDSFGNTSKILLLSSSVDLTTLDFEMEREYYLSIIAINFNTNIGTDKKYVIASNQSHQVTTMRYSQPVGLDVVDGKIVFNINDFVNSTFMQDMKNYFENEMPQDTQSVSQYYNIIGGKQYSTPFSFSPQTLVTTRMKIKFTSVIDGAETDTNYYIIVDATTLLPNTDDTKIKVYEGEEQSYVDVLTAYRDKVLSDPNLNTVYASNTNSMIEQIMASNFGIGDNRILVDDLYRSLPEGEYLVSVCQTGSLNFINSTYSTGVKVYISAPSGISLEEETIDGKVNYVAVLSPTMNMVDVGSGRYEKKVAQRYKMQWKYLDDELNYLYNDFIIQYSGTKWQLSYNGIDLSQAISNVGTNEIPNFKINMTVLRQILKGTEQEGLIVENKPITIDIFAYSQDDGYVVNGKSAKFEVNYLALNSENITFIDGEFVVSGLDNAYEMLIRYKHTSYSERSLTKSFQNNEVKVGFDTFGIYDYVVLQVNGATTPYQIFVASYSYEIKGLYKLSSPNLSTGENNINVSYDDEDLKYMSTINFSMGNNVSMEEGYEGKDAGFNYHSSITGADGNIISYVVGSDPVERPSELEAKEFSVYLNGNTGEFVKSSETATNGDILLYFQTLHATGSSRAVMSSSISSVKARMLPEIASIDLLNGNISLTDNTYQSNIATDSNATDGSGNIVYEIVVDYFAKDNTSSEDEMIKLRSEVYYSERLDDVIKDGLTQIIDSKFINSDYDRFTISVTKLGAIRSSAGASNAKITLEGTHLLINNSVYYGESSFAEFDGDGKPEVHILRSKTVTSPMMTRSPSPYLMNNSNGVEDGEIKFVISDLMYYSDNAETKEDNTSKRISVVAQYNNGTGIVNEVLDGKFEFETSTESGESDKVFVSFKPNDGLFKGVEGVIKIDIRVHGKLIYDGEEKEAINSTSLFINNVHKLTKIDEKYYSIKFVKEESKYKTYLDFSKYFENISISNDKNCYKIVVNETDITYTSKSKLFALEDEIKSLKIQAIDNQETNTTNPKKLIFSDLVERNLTKTINDGLNVSWNDELKRFEWAWDVDQVDSYEYFVQAKVDGTTETDIVTNNFYTLKQQGYIASGDFMIFARKLSDDDETIYTFSEEVVYGGDAIECNLFADGEGTAENPYEIETVEHFINIGKRNTQGNQTYFKLKNDISIDLKDMFDESGNPIINVFHGIFDGDGKRITVTASTIGNLIEQYTSSLPGANNVNFNKYASLFHTISAEAVVKNLNLALDINYAELKNSNIIISPLSAYNYGSINNVWVSSFTVSRLNGSISNTSSGGNVFVGGIVSMNYGKISNCANVADVKYIMEQQLALNFGYAGICIVNGYKTSATGEIKYCFNKADKEITVTTNSNVVYLAGIALANSGLISTSGNDGALRLSAGQSVSNFAGYFAGITVSSSKGTLSYLYNNGIIEKSVTAGTLNCGAITYALAGGKINTLVTTVESQPLVVYCTSAPMSEGVNYAISGSGTNVAISTQVLTAVDIHCGNDYLLSITESEGVFTASIS